ncbi:DUF6090 family protein [Robiginitalea aurantiaca]|uniref:DUF6090 family protein n=1 Tax=Robiginitalea aurantiaca TaxID=3056915 RepID=A0ABT7WBI1_9FLAO|nr:DUF6090 family protein [Robiginitalea aurantiaca]MDM9630262.1 DUF6090 family protein [Robiginitalea aurantiaca]
MLRFFRQIRQRLLTDNKFSKYLLYAVGEILLVVIGILIALQVDRWNELRKDRELESNLLIGLRDDLSNDIEQIQGRVNESHLDLLRTIGRFDSVTQLEDLDLHYMDSLFYSRCIRPRNTFFPQNGTYQSIINNGNSNIIRNNELLKGIQIIYDRLYVALISHGDRLDMFNDQFRYNMVKSRALDSMNRILFFKQPSTLNELRHWLERNVHYNRNVNDDSRYIANIIEEIDRELGTIN